ncbi:MAG: DNA-deoxyinosine glycosylase [Clostridia bacterium]|nr:DNA-deoxyinosine glycosylase [Clostridia bacterium]
MRIEHPFDPVYDENSKILILGSFPSVRSRADNFYYGHPQNRFWKLLAKLYGAPTPQTVEEKRAFLLRNGIALWDVIASCEIENSSDQSIRNAVVNDLSKIFEKADIRAVFVNGKAAFRLYRKYHEREAVCLPSTSPANAAWTMEKLEKAWALIIESNCKAK